MSKLKGIPTTGHSLRLPSIAIFVFLGCLILLRPNLLLTVLAFAFLNGVASLPLVFAAGPRLASAAFASAVLFTATLLFSEWGFSTPKPMVHLNWFTFAPGMLLMLGWLAWPLLPAAIRHKSTTTQTGGQLG